MCATVGHHRTSKPRDPPRIPHPLSPRVGQMSQPLTLDMRVVSRLHEECGAARWHVSTEAFGNALLRGVNKSSGGPVPNDKLEQHARGLHLADLALACGCAAGDDEAWHHFIATYRPVLQRSADALEPGGGARDLADGLYAELFGVTDGRAAKPSLFRYYHGRSSLATWLRAVLSQRHVDRLRERRRTEPLPESDAPGELAAATTDPAPERARILSLMRAALAFALAMLPPPDRLRLSCYYARQMTLAQIGRLLGEHEATVSRHVARSRREIRSTVEAFLARQGLVEAEVDDCFRSIAADPGDLDLGTLLATDEAGASTRKNPAEFRSMKGAV